MHKFPKSQRPNQSEYRSYRGNVCPKESSVLVSAMVAAVLGCMLTLPAAADDGASKGTVFVEMNSVSGKYTVEEARQALAIRLPERTVAPMPTDTAPPCPTRGAEDRLVRFAEQADGSLALQVISCVDGSVALQDRTLFKDTETETLRNAAVAALVVLDIPPEDERPEAAKKPEPTPPSPAPSRPSRPVPLIVLAPGLTAAFTGHVVFTGSLEAGVLFPNRLGLLFGADFSTPRRGTAVKKNEAPEEGTEIGVTDFDFRLGLIFELDFARRGFLIPGAGLRYTHAAVRNVSGTKFEIEEINPASRGAVFVRLDLGVHLLSFLDLALWVMPAVSFGERRYEVRGETALGLGFGTVNAAVSLRFHW